MAIYDEQNREIPDPTPLALPLGYERPETLAQIMGRIIQQNQHLEQLQELETPEEADDFYVDDHDDIEFTSQHEFKDMAEEFVVEKPEEQPMPNTDEKTPNETKEKPLEESPKKIEETASKE